MIFGKKLKGSGLDDSEPDPFRVFHFMSFRAVRGSKNKHLLARLLHHPLIITRRHACGPTELAGEGTLACVTDAERHRRNRGVARSECLLCPVDAQRAGNY